MGDQAAKTTYQLPTGLASGQSVLAVGGDLKCVPGVLCGRELRHGPVIGDLAEPAAYRRFTAYAEKAQGEASAARLTVAHDLHPSYLSTFWAVAHAPDRIGVQHHHAHVASGLVSAGETGPVIGVAADGTGYGTDGAIWGCEVMLCDLAAFERLGHLRYFPLPGGDRAARETWRPALSLVRETYGATWREQAGTLFENLPIADVAAVERMLQRDIGCVKTSSLGRLFDAAAFLLGLGSFNETEAQAAIALEQAAAQCDTAPSLPFEIVVEPRFSCHHLEMDARPTIRALVEGVRDGADRAELASGFHQAVAGMLATTVEMVADRTGIRRAAVSGGCFVNQVLSTGMAAELAGRGVELLPRGEVAVGDAGLAVGQAAIAAAQLEQAAAAGR